MIVSSVGRKTKFVSKMYKKVLISIMENLIPMHDCAIVQWRNCGGRGKKRTRGPAEKVSVFENNPGKFAAVSDRLSQRSGLDACQKSDKEWVLNCLLEFPGIFTPKFFIQVEAFHGNMNEAPLKNRY